MLLSSSTERTLEMCVPMERCTPEQLMHSMVARLTDAHTGSAGAGQGVG